LLNEVNDVQNELGIKLVSATERAVVSTSAPANVSFINAVDSEPSPQIEYVCTLRALRHETTPLTGRGLSVV